MFRIKYYQFDFLCDVYNYIMHIWMKDYHNDMLIYPISNGNFCYNSKGLTQTMCIVKDYLNNNPNKDKLFDFELEYGEIRSHNDIFKIEMILYFKLIKKIKSLCVCENEMKFGVKDYINLKSSNKMCSLFFICHM